MSYLDPDLPNLTSLTDQESQLLAMSVGTHKQRRPLQPYEVATLIGKAKEAGMAVADIGLEIGLSKTVLASFLSLLKLTPRIQGIVSWNRSRTSMTMEAASQLAKFESAEQEQIANLILQRSVTGAELRSGVQLSRRSKLTLVDAIDEVVGRRPIIVNFSVFIGTIADADIVTELISRNQNERDSFLRQVCVSEFGSNFQSGVLGTHQLTLVFDVLPEILNGASADGTVDHIASEIMKRSQQYAS
jgi:hypothetical protein